MSSATKSPNARQFFARHGLLSKWHPRYEYRAGQLEMAEAIESSLAEKKHLLVDAGTGTGKTLAYLVPAILSGKRVVVSTGTKNLQEQLFHKDIPFLQKHFDKPLEVCYMKGRNNYACRQKIYDAEKQPILSGLEEIADFQVIREWEKTTKTGDRSEIKTLPESSSAWHKIDARREMCAGQKCPQFERCFLTQMHQRAHESDIIIVNHHLFFADLAVKDGEFGGIIPEYAAVVFDEAHEIEDVVGKYFGAGASNYQFQELVRDIANVSRAKQFGSGELDRVLATLDDRAGLFFALFGESEGRSVFKGHTAFFERYESQYDDVQRALELIATHLQLVKNAPDEVIPLFRRTQELREQLDYWSRGDDRSVVYWIERRGRGVFLQATPIDVSSILEEKLFDKLDTVVLTSATLAVGGNFDFAEKRLGIQHTRSLVVPSHFEYRKQALLYVAQHMPDPRSPAFPKAAAEEITRILEHSRGRAFVLFTSYQQMRMAHDRVSLEIDYPTLLQGTGPRSALLDEFRRTPHCVLFATSSFWQGVDVQGDQLSCVIIDKLPFAVPSDPIVEARIQRIREDGGNPFCDYQIPQAALALKQGFGRLIRSKTDRGVLVLLDNRITKQRYGQVFFDSLPDYGFTTNLSDVERFFDV
ncbi:MAG TPA: helicase C-terminal domain-containing protein [Bryobacteraceae bacterium]|nr:helicase C-terminal domain-containing protein [Bryobacteraceae bacterium]